PRSGKRISRDTSKKGRSVTAMVQSCREHDDATPAVGEVQITEEALPATRRMGSMANEFKFGMRRACEDNRTIIPSRKTHSGGRPPVRNATVRKASDPNT